MTSSTLHLGDCRKVLHSAYKDNEFDACVCDPPYELNFMNSGWDRSGIAFDSYMWREVYRTLKPGAYLLAFGGTRTYHRMAVAIEDAGFEIRDCISWMYSSGFPKSLNVSKAIDRRLGKEPTIVGYDDEKRKKQTGQTGTAALNDRIANDGRITVATTEEAAKWSGWGSALKPGQELICLARKPFKGALVDNVLTHGTGALNIDACRIESDGGHHRGDEPSRNTRYTDRGSTNFAPLPGPRGGDPSGRWPANVMLSEETAEFLDEKYGKQKGGFVRNRTAGARPFNNDGAVTNYVTTARIDEPDAGISRYFYVSKANKKERNLGVDGINDHATVKPLALIEELVKLVTPPGGRVLDPFMGSGTTGIAAENLGVDFTGIELHEDHFTICRQRIDHVRRLRCKDEAIVN